MHKNLLLSALILLTFLGVADSAYLAEKALTGSALTCSIKGLEGCNVVAQSVYSHLFGIPLGVYGIGFYGVMFVLAILALKAPRKFVHDALAAIGVLGLLASSVFIGIQIFLIKALCIYCLASGAISLFACVVSVALWRKFRVSIKNESVKTSGAGKAGTAALLALFCFLSPSATHAATVLSGQSITVSSSTPDNAYYAGGQVRVNVPLPGDLVAAAGTITVSAPVTGDVLAVGATVDIQKPVSRNVRAVAGRINVQDNVAGDLVVAGGFVTVTGKAKDMNIGGGTVQILNGSNGPVTVYGADVYLSGEFNGNVEVVAADKVTIGEGTVIHGVFKYNAPQQADIPMSAQILGGVDYIGSAAYLPTVQQAKTFAVAGLWVFFMVKLTAALVVTGLIAGLFPLFTDRVIESTLSRSFERFVLLTLLGFAGMVAIPVLILLLLVSFVGIGLASILGAAYVLFLLIAYMYAAVLVGSAIMYLARKRKQITWRAALLGVLVLAVVGIIPVVGLVIRVLLMATAGGAILSLFYKFAFRKQKIDLSEF